jgi:hypothetical protein
LKGKAQMEKCFLLATLILISSACTSVLKPGTSEAAVRLKLFCERPEDFAIVYEGSTFRFSQAGTVEFTTRSYAPSCDMYLCGLMKVNDTSRKREPRFVLKHGTRKIKTFCLRDISGLSKDAANFSLFSIEEAKTW